MRDAPVSETRLEAEPSADPQRLRPILVLIVLMGLIACERVAQGLQPPFWKFGLHTTTLGIFLLEAGEGVGYVLGGLIVGAIATKLLLRDIVPFEETDRDIPNIFG